MALETVERLEEGIYACIALFLLAGGALLLFGAARYAVTNIGTLDLKDLVVTVLDQALLVFMVAELLHTVRITLRDRSLAAEPFLIIGLIAGVRRILVITAKNENVGAGPEFHVFWVELLLLVGLVVAMVVALFIYRRAYANQPEGPDL